MSRNPRVDAYIAQSAAFARPILKRFRTAVHKAVPSAVETIKWGVPCYEDGGAILCLTAAFKRHCACVFWRGRKPQSVNAKALRRVTAIGELPPARTLAAAMKEAAAGGAAPVRKTAGAKRTPARTVVVPPVFLRALKQNSRARAAFEAFPPSHRREYAEWIASAKTDETRDRRIATAIEWIASGKSRNWKYQ